MIIHNHTTKSWPSTKEDFSTYRWSGNALWSIGQRPTRKRSMPHKGKVDAARFVFSAPKGQSLMLVVSPADNHILFIHYLFAINDAEPGLYFRQELPCEVVYPA